VPDDIEDVLLDALLDCLAFIDLSDDQVVQPDAAQHVLEDVAGRFDTLDEDARAELVGMILSRAADESRADRKTFLEAIPSHFGLLDDDET
jgi:hypothetical protein